MSRRRSLSDDEDALWRTFAQSITPLHASRQSAKPRHAAKPQQTAPSHSTTTTAKTAKDAARPVAALAAPLASLDRRFKQRVARGREPIDGRLDLHGMTQQQAHAALWRFLHRAQADGARTVIVVTGKGAGKAAPAGATSERGVLRRQVPMWLALPEFRRLVVGFVDAHTGHGGEGALYVRLRRLR